MNIFSPGRTGTLFVMLSIASVLTACKDENERVVPYSKVEKGTFYIDLYEEGQIDAVNSITISSPRIQYRYLNGNLKISQMVSDGAEVQAGDTVIVFDPSGVETSIQDYEERLDLNLAELEKLMAQQSSEMEEMTADLKITEISHEIAKIKNDQAEYESKVARDEIKIALEKAEISLNQSREQLENQKKIHLEDLKQKNVQIEQSREYLRQAKKALEMLYVITPNPGLVIVEDNWSTGTKYQIGDQTWGGVPLMRLPDLSKLKATININEVDISKIKKGLEVEIRPDAFSESVFKGHVTTVANLAVDKSRDNKSKVFPVEVILDETDKRLSPGNTVSCRILIDKLDDVLFIPVDALMTEGGTNFVYKKRASGYEKVNVEIGQHNNDYVVITKGLSEKDEVALIDPFATEEETTEEQTSQTSQGA